MTRRYTGGFLSAKEQATDANTANGIFTLAEAQEKTALGNFPVGRWTPQRSLRFRSSATAYLNRTFATPTSGTIWTWSGWVKRGTLGASQTLFSGQVDVNNWGYIGFLSGDTLTFQQADAGSVTSTVTTTQVFRDPSAWYHIVVVFDSTQAIAANRLKMYVNGVQITAFGTATYLGQNTTSRINAAVAHQLGRYISAANYFDGCLAEINFIDGQALDSTYFGTTDPQTDTWISKRYTGTYGTNGFYLPFNVDTTFSADYLVLAGGGGGGSNRGGGGGAGGFRTSAGTSGGNSSAESALTLSTGVAYTITVGAGGGSASNGSNSVLGSITSTGGGRGEGASSGSGSTGGSGGGGSGDAGVGLAGTSGQGYAGGNGFDTGSGRAAGGGGGAGAVGGNASANLAGNGGAGLASSISGSSVTYAGGGGGGYLNNGAAGTAGTGGSGIGGNGASGSSGGTGGSANSNTGSGGGGAAAVASGGSGGSGIVIIKIPQTRSAFFSSGVTYSGGTPSGGYKIYSITATSTTSETVTFA